MIKALFGADSFTRDQALARLRDEASDPALADFNTITLEGDKLAAEELAAAVQAMPFLADRRVVIVRGLLDRFESKSGGDASGKSGDGRSAERRWRPFADVLGSVPSSTLVVLVDGPIKRRQNPLLKALEPSLLIEEFRQPDVRQLPNWIAQRVREVGGTIDQAAAVALANAVGPDLRTLANEIEKLALYANGTEIDRQAVDLLVPETREASIFALTDRLLERDRSRALRLVSDLLDEGEPPLTVLFMITRQYRQLLQVSDLSSRRASFEEMRRITGIRSDYGLQKVLGQSRRYSLGQLKATYQLLLNTDRRIKTGAAEPRAALEMLIVALCEMGAPARQASTRR